MILANQPAKACGSRDSGSDLAYPERYGSPTKMRESNTKIIILCRALIKLTFHAPQILVPQIFL